MSWIPARKRAPAIRGFEARQAVADAIAELADLPCAEIARRLQAGWPGISKNQVKQIRYDFDLPTVEPGRPKVLTCPSGHAKDRWTVAANGRRYRVCGRCHSARSATRHATLKGY